MKLLGWESLYAKHQRNKVKLKISWRFVLVLILNRVCAKCIMLCNCLCSSSSRHSASIIWNIQKFGAKNYFTDHQTTQYKTVFEIQFWSLKYTAVIRIRKNLSNFPFLSKWYNTRQEPVCQCKQPTENSFQSSNCIYLLKLYDKSVIILLTNVLANICSKISNIWLILWMVYTCNVKGKLKNWVEMNILCTTDQDHQWWVITVVYIPVSLKSFSWY